MLSVHREGSRPLSAYLTKYSDDGSPCCIFQRQHPRGALSIHGEGAAAMHGAALPDVLQLQEAWGPSGSAAHNAGIRHATLHHRGLQKSGDVVALFVAG